MVVGVAAEEVGLDGREGDGVEEEAEEGKGEKPSLGVAGDEDPGAVEEVGGVGAGESLEAAGGGVRRRRPPPGRWRGRGFLMPIDVVEEREARGEGRRGNWIGGRGGCGTDDGSGGREGGEEKEREGWEVGGEVDGNGE